jgi:hypothetical protein
MTNSSQTERFLVGEIAIAINSKWHPDHEGAEALVIDVLREHSVSVYPGARETRRMLAYLVEIGGARYALEPHQLRKRRPPTERQEVGSWEECPWQPEAEHA